MDSIFFSRQFDNLCLLTEVFIPFAIHEKIDDLA